MATFGMLSLIMICIGTGLFVPRATIGVLLCILMSGGWLFLTVPLVIGGLIIDFASY